MGRRWLLCAVCLLLPGWAMADCAFAVKAHLYRAAAWDNEFGQLDESIQAIQDLGFPCVATGFEWHPSKPPGNNKWKGNFETVVRKLDQNGIAILGQIGTNAKWIRRSDLKKWRGWLQTRLKKYPTIQTWEVMNEVNLQNFWPRQFTVGDYGNLLSDAIQVSKGRKDLITAGLARNAKRDAFLDMMIQKGYLNRVRGVGLHTYGLKGGQLLDYVDQMENRFRSKTGRTYPVWITEYGWSTPGGQRKAQPSAHQRGSIQEQRDYLLQALLIASYSPHIDNLTIFELRDDSIRSGFGLYDIDFNIKPAGQAVKIFMGHLRDVPLQLSYRNGSQLAFKAPRAEPVLRYIAWGKKAVNWVERRAAGLSPYVVRQARLRKLVGKSSRTDVIFWLDCKGPNRSGIRSIGGCSAS